MIYLFDSLSLYQKILTLSIIVPLLIFIVLNLCLYFFKYFKKMISDDILTSISTGLLMSITFLNYLPSSLELNSSKSFALTMIIVLVVLLLVESYITPLLSFNLLPKKSHDVNLSCQHEHHHHYHPFSHTTSFSALGCLIVCVFFDGLKITSGLLIDSVTTFTTIAGTLLHIIPEGLTVLLLIKKFQLSYKKSTLIQVIYCVSCAIGMSMTFFMYNIQIKAGVILSISTATLFYLIFIHLLPVSFKKKNQKWFLSSLLLTTLFLLSYH